jgi:hypothetical protein
MDTQPIGQTLMNQPHDCALNLQAARRHNAFGKS